MGESASAQSSSRADEGESKRLASGEHVANPLLVDDEVQGFTPLGAENEVDEDGGHCE